MGAVTSATACIHAAVLHRSTDSCADDIALLSRHPRQLTHAILSSTVKLPTRAVAKADAPQTFASFVIHKLLAKHSRLATQSANALLCCNNAHVPSLRSAIVSVVRFGGLLTPRATGAAQS